VSLTFSQNMARHDSLAHIIAISLLSGPWAADGMKSRLRGLLGPPVKPHGLVPRVLRAFGHEPPPPSLRHLTQIVESDPGYLRMRNKDELRDGIARHSSLNIPSPIMQPVPGNPQSWSVPEIVTPGQLADWCGVASGHLDWLADCQRLERHVRHEQLRNYQYRWIGKRGSGCRLIESPKFRLKAIQRRVLDAILSHIPVHDAAHAFRSLRSPLTCATPHVGKAIVLRIDLRDFFPSIPMRRVFGIFRTAGYPEAVARLLAGLFTNSVPNFVLDACQNVDATQRRQLFVRYSVAHLTQGAPTSPALANLCAFKLDCRLNGLARKFDASYTRYADDLVFSGDRHFFRRLSRFRILACAIAIDEGYDIRRRKTREMPASQRQKTVGLVVNSRPAVDRREFDRLKATLMNCVRFGSNTQNRGDHADFQAHLRGKIAWVAGLSDARRKKLLDLFHRIEW